MVGLPLLAMTALASGELLLRKLADRGIPGALPFVQHLTLWAGFLGAFWLAGQGKLLKLATVELFPARIRGFLERAGRGFGALVAVLLGASALELVASERVAGSELALGVPNWIGLLVLPLAYFGIALRLAWVPGSAWRERWALSGFLLLGFLLAWKPQSLAGLSPVSGLLAVGLGALLGAPLFALLGGMALWLFMAAEIPIAAVAAETYRLAASPTLPAIPLFTLAGCLLAAGGSAERLLGLFRALVGWLPGGTALVVAILCAFFTTLTGGSGVTILAVGALLFQALRAQGYSDRFSIGLLTSSGSLGLLFPPAVPLVLYGIVASQPIPELYRGGLIPGMLILAATAWLAVREGRRVEPRAEAFSFHRLVRAAGVAWGELCLPVVVLGLLFSGWATLLESAAVAAVFAGVLVFVLRRDRPLRELGGVLLEATGLVGGILLILAVANGLASYLVDAEIPARLTDWAERSLGSQAAFLLALNAVLLLIGCLMDIYSAIAVVVPLMVPIAASFGVDPIHLGIVFVANLELGFLTPPVGVNLFLAAYRFERPLGEIVRAVAPWILVRAVFVLVITYVPFLALALVR